MEPYNGCDLENEETVRGSEMSCKDGIDNDCDGKTGCSDNDCKDLIECQLGCTDECGFSRTRCSGNYLQFCGNYDSDPCLKWPQSTAGNGNSYCDNGCSNGQCVQETVSKDVEERKVKTEGKRDLTKKYVDSLEKTLKEKDALTPPSGSHNRSVAHSP